ncbi:MAG: hypothetical protein AAGN82_07970 [Myxococcota bacterium]
MRRNTEAAKRAADRREREDAAERLSDAIPTLGDLTLHIEERRLDRDEIEVSHTRRVVVARAPAHFEMGCSDRRCDGGHDVTPTVMKALRAGQTAFSGKHACCGQSKHGPCKLELHYDAVASYADAAQ